MIVPISLRTEPLVILNSRPDFALAPLSVAHQCNDKRSIPVRRIASDDNAQRRTAVSAKLPEPDMPDPRNEARKADLAPSGAD